ncbi:trypsin-like peptidase domain-containing protein [Streptomyces sp. G2]|uniref:S1C family serine protease n=1 Tax=Streptomyces sp. G2 TaxID=1684471 RepID=UPI002030DEC0|nr:trypsin-like peptidase domain-containing protein [Streptomyces sp. G2]MCM1944303.1 trypsin-like peptidase domain-containing protein [Streptomyces sp. G2]
MNDGKPNWWSRPSTPPEAARIPTPSPAEEGDFPLQAPDPAESAVPEPAAEAPAAPTVDMTKEPAAAEPTPSEPTPAVPAPAESAPAVPAPAVTAAESVPAPETRAVAAVPAAPRPLHEPDEYRTPPYGEPGPWAPAPPVQHPAAPVPPPQAAVPPQGAVPPPQGPVPPHAWGQYDPWGAGPGAVPPPPRKKSRRGLALVGALAFALLTGVIGGGVGAYVERNGGIGTVELPQAEAGSADRAPDSVAGIAAGALPGVVTLHVSGGGSAGTGTGFVLDNRGHILTNNHVVDAAATSGDITVTFSSGETASAKLIGKDTGYDLAVVQVTGVRGLKPLPLGNSDDVRVGDPVVAIGAPFDLSNTVTSGIISAKERPITAGGEKGDGSDISYVDALQTDAPINPGNSGGPLLDGKGRVIGINSAIRAAGGSGEGDGGSGGQAGSIGLGFAIPVNQGKRVAEELINTGKATHPVIGVSLDMQFNGDGARVGDKGKDGTPSVTPDGPAAKAGLRPGDVITKVDGQRVHNGEELIVKIRAHRPGDALALTLTRDGRELTRTVTLGSAQGT